MQNERKSLHPIKKNICEVCGLRSATETHHIIPLVFEGTNDEENLADLCSICHRFAPSTKEEFEMYKLSGGVEIQSVRSGAMFAFLMMEEEGLLSVKPGSNYLMTETVVSRFREMSVNPSVKAEQERKKIVSKIIKSAENLYKKNPHWKVHTAISMARKKWIKNNPQDNIDFEFEKRISLASLIITYSKKQLL